MKAFLPILIMCTFSCAPRRPTAAAFRVVPADPSYLLRSPDSKDIPFPDVPGSFTGVGSGWVDLRPQMSLRIENAYFREGAPRRGLAGFIGTEVAHYRVRAQGLRLTSVETKVAQPPKDQPPVQELLPAALARYRFHRFYYEVLFRSKGAVEGAVVLGAGSMDALERLGARLLADPDAVCSSPARQCAVFPETCTVSLEMEVIVNGAPRIILWGSLLGSVVSHPRGVELLRNYAGRLTPVEMDPNDANALRLPLLPGDRIRQ